MSIPVDSLVVTIRERLTQDVETRVGRAMETLLGLIKEAYARPAGNSPQGVPLGFTATHGESGAIGGLSYEVKRAQKFIEGVIGLTDAARYLGNLEYGEGGTHGAPSTGALFTRERMPPVEKIAAWIVLAGIAPHGPHGEEVTVPRHRRKGAPSQAGYEKAVMSMAWAIAIKRKRLGRPAMRVIERTINQHRQTLTNLLSGA